MCPTRSWWARPDPSPSPPAPMAPTVANMPGGSGTGSAPLGPARSESKCTHHAFMPHMPAISPAKLITQLCNARKQSGRVCSPGSVGAFMPSPLLKARLWPPEPVNNRPSGKLVLRISATRLPPAAAEAQLSFAALRSRFTTHQCLTLHRNRMKFTAMNTCISVN